MSTSKEQIARLNADDEERLERVRLAASEKKREEAGGDDVEQKPSAYLTAAPIRPNGRASQIQAEMLADSDS